MEFGCHNDLYGEMTYLRVQLRDQAFVLIPQNMVRETTV